MEKCEHFVWYGVCKASRFRYPVLNPEDNNTSQRTMAGAVGLKLLPEGLTPHVHTIDVSILVHCAKNLNGIVESRTLEPTVSLLYSQGSSALLVAHTVDRGGSRISHVTLATNIKRYPAEIGDSPVYFGRLEYYRRVIETSELNCVVRKLQLGEPVHGGAVPFISFRRIH